MKIELFDVKEFIDLNHLKEIKSPILFQRGNVPDPDGLISNEIFGVDVRSRKSTFAYIKLNGHFFAPHAYKVLKRLYRNIEKIINGDFYYSLDKDGHIIQDDNGKTGLESIYDDWEKIKWEKTIASSGMRNERIDLLTKSKKTEIFTEYEIVIPAFYRDIKADQAGGGETEPINNMYSKIIRLASLLKERDMFDFTLHSTYYNIQSLLVDVYDFFKTKLANKNGMIRRFLMGKNVDYCVRSVISTPNFHAEKAKDMEIDFRHIGIPISQVCSLCYPFMMKWIKDFFENNIIQQQNSMLIAGSYEGINIYKPELYYTDDYIKKMMDQYIRNPESRFNPILIPLEGGKFGKARFSGKIVDYNNEKEYSTISDRPFTVTDLLYMAAYDVTKDKHALITRYPVTDSYGVFLGRVRVTSTLTTIPVKVNNTIYKFYPNIDMSIPKQNIAIYFKESIQFSNAYLKGIGGDYDGDQITAKILWTQEANAEIERVINSKSYFITPTGKNIRVVGNEAIQTLYALTKDPLKDSKTVSQQFVEELLSMKSSDITFDYLVELFGRKKEGNTTVVPPYHPTDIAVIRPMKYHKNKQAIRTTVGRIIFNKIILEDNQLEEKVGFVNHKINAKGLSELEKILAILLTSDTITAEQMASYIDSRDWLGLQLHAVITTSFTAPTIEIPKEVKTLKDQLLKKYKKELDAGDVVTAEKVEKELIKKTEEVLEGDPGLDLYYSGARGSIGNNLKNIILMKGAIYNPLTKKYDIVRSSLMDGIEKSDIPAFANSVVTGAYPKAVGTADSGYLAKQLIAGMQTEIIDDDGTDCGTDKTLEVTLTESNKSDFINRNIKVNGKPYLLDENNIKNYIGKKIHVYSPMFCTGDRLCSKCTGRYNNKFIGLDASKVATTLTNLNMKKFHNNVIKTNQLNPDEILLLNKKQGIFDATATDIILKDAYCEIYIPFFYFDKNYKFAESMGSYISSFGIVNVGIFTNGKLQYIDTMNIPLWIDIQAPNVESRVVDIPGEGEIPCRVIKFFKGNKVCNRSLIVDSENAQTYLRFITFGKVPTSIPYSKTLQVWKENQELSDVDFGVPSIIEEVILSVSYRYKKDTSYKFAKIIGKPNSQVSEYDYSMASIRQVCQYASTFSAITFEDMDSMITASVNREREKKTESDSPVEKLFKL